MNGDQSNQSDMDGAFGAANWEGFFFESAPAATVFSSTRQFVFIDGSRLGANALNAYLQANRTVIENWVTAGGHLLLNAAPNEGGNIDFGFGGITLNFNSGYNTASGTATVVTGHPIATGPFSPAGSSYVGNSFSHATVSGSGLSAVIIGQAGTIVGYKTWGSGYVFTGGMTPATYHGPQPNAHNLLQNILAFTLLVFCTAPAVTAPDAITTTTDAGQCGASVSFQAMATGTTPTLSYTAGGTTITSPHIFPVGTITVTATATNSCGIDSKTFAVTVTDDTAPTALAHDVYVTLANGVASVSAADVNNGSSDACGILGLSLGNSRTSFTCADANTNVPVTLTVTDNNSNTSNVQAVVHISGIIPTATIGVTPANNVFTGGVPTTLYLGYGPQSVTLTASGGQSYSWSPAAGLSNAAIANPVFTATTAGTFTYTVTATTATGCTASSGVTIKVVNARCGNNNDKVLVCHNGHVICISSSAVNTHLTGHVGDQLSACAPGARAGATAVAGAGPTELSAYPNPAADQATVSFRAPLAGQAQVLVYSQMGQRVATLYDGDVRGGQLYSLTLDSHTLTPGLYECRLVVNGKAETVRLVITR